MTFGPREFNKLLEAERFEVAQAMVDHGGGFVHDLGLLLRRADIDNAFRLRFAFPDYWAKYLAISRQGEERPSVFGMRIVAGEQLGQRPMVIGTPNQATGDVQIGLLGASAMVTIPGARMREIVEEAYHSVGLEP